MKIQVVRYRWVFFLISAVVLIPGVFSLLRNGVRPSIDFTSGSLIEVLVPAENTEAVRTAVESVYEVGSIQESGIGQYILKGPEATNEQKNAVTTALLERYGTAEVLRFESIGPTVSAELLTKTLVAVGIVAVIIMLYIARQFKEWKYGICAVLAMFHDSLVLVGSFSLLGYFYGVEVDTLFVTAVLTTLSFSVHDTIVVYHRIRELKQKHSTLDTKTILDMAVLNTIVRSLNNSLTIILMLTTLSLLGGESIRWFAVALLIGAVTGTYSSTGVAIPLISVWEDIAAWRKARRSHERKSLARKP